ncbi:ATP-binding response regulator [Gloeothece verrucosa]|uniref:histidine kinase n=1 Tax=Gloeothece verrucosa (strain PCC 7822) TaxID=497965 RepID=E0U536_GLOV7|nr:HAMP domain-containing sensor histidine kinase [Gloeothece verrucosa]ADN12315.1 histidine kinase [Gloeothece verrucosa PCC 7822]
MVEVKDHILLMVSQSENRRLLTDLLKTEYSLLFFVNEKSLSQDFDLCIVDGLALKRYQCQLQARREASEPVFLPFVLLISRPQMKIINDVLPAQVDEALVIPIEKVELLGRLKALLRSRRLTLELKAANEQLQHLNAFKSRFLSMASHDLRSPLSAISASAQLLQNHYHKLSRDKQERILQLMHSGVKRMTQLLNDIVIINQAEEGKLTFHPSFFNLDQFCQELVEQFQMASGSRHQIEFMSVTDSKTDHFKLFNSDFKVYMDKNLLYHIFSNLLDNAIKYSPDGGIISCKLIYQEHQVICQIKDPGIGIPLEKQQKLFEAFVRGDNVEKIRGTGLGLSIVKQCVELHGGTIACESQINLGTTFIVTLPYGYEKFH